MAVKKMSNADIRPLGDPAVDVAMGADDPLYGGLQRRAASESRKTKSQRIKAKRDRQRNKMTIDLPEWATDRIQEISSNGGFPPGHLAALLLVQGLRSLDNGEIDLNDYRYPSRMLRYEWMLQIEPFDK